MIKKRFASLNLLCGLRGNVRWSF